jgi:hypothetical protein
VQTDAHLMARGSVKYGHDGSVDAAGVGSFVSSFLAGKLSPSYKVLACILARLLRDAPRVLSLIFAEYLHLDTRRMHGVCCAAALDAHYGTPCRGG